MISIQVSNKDSRPRNIAIGLLIVFVLTYWHFTGSLPLLAEAVLPQPENGKLSSAWSFGVELLGDALYFVGVAATGFASGIWSLLLGLINLVVGKVNATPTVDAESVTRELLDKRTKQVFAAIEKPLNDLSEQVKLLQAQIEIMAHPSLVKPARKRSTTMPVKRKVQS